MIKECYKNSIDKVKNLEPNLFDIEKHMCFIKKTCSFI